MTGRNSISLSRFGWLLALLMIVLVQNVRAQQCPTNMLYLGDDPGHVQVMDQPAVRLDKAFTIEAWIKTTSAAERSTIIEKGNDGNQANYSIAIGQSNTLVARVLSPTGIITLTSDVIPSISDWHHIALVFRPNDTLVFYVDGQYSFGTKVTAPLLVTGADSLRIGRSVQSGGRPFFGSIDELRIWKTARTEDQIRDAMRTVISPTSTGLSAYFTFDDEPTNGRFYDNMHKGIVGELKGASHIITSSSPVQGRGSAYKLEVKELAMRLPRMACAGRFDTVVHVRNLGLDSVNVNFLGLSLGSSFSIAGPERLVLPADSTFWGEIRIQFNPSGSGIYNDTLFVGSASLCAGVIAIPLVDTVVSAEIQLTPASITIPKRLNCQFPVTEAITIKNPGTTPITVNNIYFEQEIGASLAGADIPFTLAPGETRNVNVKIDEGVDGLQTTKIVVALDRCDLTASVRLSVTREAIVYDVPQHVEFAERTLFGVVSADTMITFVNQSSREILVTNVTIPSNPHFTLAGPISNRAVPSGASLTIPIHFTANVCGDYSAKLRIQGVPCAVDTSISLTLNVVSPKPELSNVLDFGFTCSAKDTFVVVRNPYDRPIRLRNYESGNPSVFSSGDFPLVIPAGGEETIPVRFHPNVQGEYNTTLTLNDEKCGSTVIALRGGYGTKALVVDYPSIDFGGGCNTNRVTRRFTITNMAPRPVTLIDTNITGTNRYRFKGLTLPRTIDAGNFVAFEIEFTPEMDKLTIGNAQFVIQEGCVTDAIELYGSRESVKLTIEQSTIDFDTVCPSSSSVLGAVITNLGIDSIRIEQINVTGTGFSLAEPSTALARGVSTLKIKFSPPTQGSFAGALTFKAKNCDNVYTIQLRGSGGSNPRLSLSNNKLEFGPIRVGQGRSMCFDITNTSCVPLTIDSFSFIFSDSSFRLDPNSEDELPRTLGNGETQTICIVYAPDTRKQYEADLAIAVEGADTSRMVLSGKGVAPILEVLESSLDFGFVPLNTPKTLHLHVKNVGNADAKLTPNILPQSAVFSVSEIVDPLPPGKDTLLSVTFETREVQFYEPVLTIGESGYSQEVELRAIGAARGLVVDRTIVEYGDVRLRTPAVEEIRITANVFPVELQDYMFDEIDASMHYSIRFDTELPHTLHVPSDVITATITFSPKEEGPLNRMLVLNADASVEDVAIPLVGTGVEAHIKTVDTIHFYTVAFEDSLYREYRIENKGTFPLTVTSVSTLPPFFTDEVSSIVIQPGKFETLRVGFSPQREKEVYGILRITSDAAEGERRIVLIGKGGTATQAKPRIAYHVPDIETQIGQHILIPISVSGSQLKKFTGDSFSVKLRYDPWMLYIYDYSTFATLSNGFDITLEREDDSTLLITGQGGVLDLREGVSLIDLKGEALFGPRARTAMQVVEASPSTVSSFATATGELYITNCNDQAAGAIYKGPYSVEHAFPNPASDRTTIRYKLGFPGSADVTVHDALGRVVKVVALPERPKGDHEFELDLHDLPNGHYTGLFRSREFIERIGVIVQH